MKILYITRKFLPSIGGMQTQSYEFYHALKERKQVYLVAWGYSQKFLPIFLIIAVIKGIYHILKYNIDIIQVGDLVLSPVGLFFKCIFNKRVLAIAHGKDVAFDNIVYRAIVLNSAKKLDAIICVSNFLKQKLITKGIDSNRLFTNPNGIDFPNHNELFDKDSSASQLESKFGINLKDKKILLSVSRLVRKKGIAYFVQNIFPKIVEDTPDVILLLVGEVDGKEAKKEKSKIIYLMNKHELNERIFFLGRTNDREVLLKQIYSIADIYIMPNQHLERDFEGFGIVALEASVNQVPVVAFSVDGICDAVKNGENGILIKEDDDERFAQVIKELLRNKKRKLELGRRARIFVKENYNWDIIIDKYIKILEQIQSR